MTCYHPQILKRSKLVNPELKKNTAPIMRPCGQCIGCRLEASRQWALRIKLESSLYEKNCFITLTYDNKNLPPGETLVKAHLQNFNKRLREIAEPNRIRFYGCGEYGSRYHRPHYHLCILNYFPNDAELVRKNYLSVDRNKCKAGKVCNLYRSETIQKIWKKGFITVGDLTFQSAGYVSRYVTKKITGKIQKRHYGDKLPEFALMSRRPGIGAPWFKKYWNDVYPKDFITVEGHRMRPPVYFDYLLEKSKPQIFEQLKEKRRMNQENILQERLNDMEYYRKLITKPLKRRIEC